MRSVSSGINSYANFPPLVNRRIFPPTSETVLLRSSIFSHGRTFRGYISHRKKACVVLEIRRDWFPPVVERAAHGLKNAQRGKMEFPNFLYPKDVFAIINRLGWSAHFPQMSFAAYLFPLRNPSEALPLRRAFKGDRLLEFAHQGEKILVGVRAAGCAVCLVMIFAFRKNLPVGCILRRFCT